MDKYKYTIEFTFGEKRFEENLISDQQLFQKPEEGCKPQKSEAIFILDQIKVILSKEQLPYLPHDIIISEGNETLFSIPDLKPFI